MVKITKGKLTPSDTKNLLHMLNKNKQTLHIRTKTYILHPTANNNYRLVVYTTVCKDMPMARQEVEFTYK